MSTDYNISYSYSVGGTASQPRQSGGDQADPTLYAFDDCDEVHLPTNAVLLVSKTRPRQGIVTRDVAIALNHCRDFRTLQGHAEHLTAYMPELGGDVDGVRRTLTTVRDNGMLLAAPDYLPLLRDAADSADPPAPSRVFIITCDRPAAAGRLLESMLASAELSRHESIFLIDDSRDSDNAKANRELVEKFNLSSPAEMTYFGSAQRESLIEDLIRREPHREASIRFLLDRDHWQGQKTFGLSRTLCLLLSVGYRAVLLDDDVICQAIDSPYKSTGVQFFDGMCEADFFPSQDGWKKRYPPRTEDPLRGHLSCLGMGLGETVRHLLGGEPGQELLDGSQQQLLGRLTADSRVLITQNGTFGDPGTEDTAWAFGLSGDSLQRLLDNPETLAAKLATRQYWMGWSRPTFSGQFNMSQVTGLDNSAPLPPYFPVWRGEDQLFGAMVDFLFPDSVVLNYPWAVPHMPLEERTGHIDITPEVAGIGLVENHICDNVPREGGLSFEQRLERLARLLQELADKSDADLAAGFRCALAVDQANALRQLSDKLRAAPAEHKPWRSLLEARIKRYFAAVGRRDVPVRMGGVPEDTPEAELWTHFRTYCGDFARCLQDWPALRSAAQRPSD